jgi:hypothetical protein
MQPDKTTIDRAFDLARSGASRTITELIARLDREGCDGHQIQGRFLRKQLTALMEAEANARDGNCSCETRSMAVKTEPEFRITSQAAGAPGEPQRWCSCHHFRAMLALLVTLVPWQLAAMQFVSTIICPLRPSIG